MDYCPDCVKCEDHWSGSMSLSCHEYCEDFKRWKVEQEGYYREATAKSDHS